MFYNDLPENKKVYIEDDYRPIKTRVKKLVHKDINVDGGLQIYSSCQWVDSNYLGKRIGVTLDLIKKVEFINSYSFIYSPRPGTKAYDYKLIDKEISKERLIKVQNLLTKHQLDTNSELRGQNIKVLVENKIKGQNKLFGRNKYLNSVIFNGDEKLVGNLVDVNIEDFNQNTLFGKFKKYNIKAA